MFRRKSIRVIFLRRRLEKFEFFLSLITRMILLNKFMALISNIFRQNMPRWKTIVINFRKYSISHVKYNNNEGKHSNLERFIIESINKSIEFNRGKLHRIIFTPPKGTLIVIKPHKAASIVECGCVSYKTYLSNDTTIRPNEKSVCIDVLARHYKKLFN